MTFLTVNLAKRGQKVSSEEEMQRKQEEERSKEETENRSEKSNEIEEVLLAEGPYNDQIIIEDEKTDSFNIAEDKKLFNTGKLAITLKNQIVIDKRQINKDMANFLKSNLNFINKRLKKIEIFL